MQTMNLRIEIAGERVNEYRITDHDLEFRAFDPTGQSLADQRSGWRRLTAEELILHFRFETVVAHWFLDKTAELDEECLKAA